jgi:putative transposase
VKVTQAHRFALDPSPAQERMLRSHAGAARFAWNWGLAKCRDRYESEGNWYSGTDLHKLWNAAKKADPALGWWGENSKCAYQEAFRDWEQALGGFVKSKKCERKGRRLGFPRFKKRGKCRDSFRFSTGAIRCAQNTVALPRLGMIRTHEPVRKLARRLGNGTARILSATVTRGAQRWYVSFTVEVERAVPEHHARPGSVIGIDLGVKTLLTGVDGQGNVVTVAGPKALRSSLRRLRRASRAHSRTVKGYETVVAEDLNVAGMVTNRRLARAIADQGFGQARRMLSYKTTWHGGRLVLAGRWFPSSKTCSGCGAVKAELALSERTYTCAACGLVIDRDVNAACNLLKFAASGAEKVNACGGTARPSLAGRVPVKQEPGTAYAGQAGTASERPLTTVKELTHAH